MGPCQAKTLPSISKHLARSGHGLQNAGSNQKQQLEDALSAGYVLSIVLNKTNYLMVLSSE